MIMEILQANAVAPDIWQFCRISGGQRVAALSAKLSFHVT